MKRVKKLILVTCIIFSALILIYFTMYESLDVRTTWTFLAVSVLDALLSLLLLSSESRSFLRLLVRQTLYFGLVMISALAAIVWLGYEISKRAVLLNGAAVVLIFVIVKSLLYRQDKQDAADINEYLAGRHKKQ